MHLPARTALSDCDLHDAIESHLTGLRRMLDYTDDCCDVTVDLDPGTDPDEVLRGFTRGVYWAAKLLPGAGVVRVYRVEADWK